MTKEIDLSFARSHAEWRNMVRVYEIIDEVNRDSDPDKWGGYVPVDVVTDVISMAMFNKTVWVTKYGVKRPHLPETIKTTTEDEDEAIRKAFEQMVTKGILRMSKSGTMAKPMMTADEWVEKKRTEVTRGE